MHKVNLPTDYCVTGCQKITIPSDDTSTASSGTLDPETALTNTELVYQNVSLIVWSSLTIEKLMNRIILNHYFPKTMFKQAMDFDKRFIKSGAITFNAKRRVVSGIAKDNNWIKGKEINDLEKCLSKVEEYRNAFAHGQVTYDMNKGPIITYFRGNLFEKQITDEFWKDIEKYYTLSFLSIKKYLGEYQNDNVQNSMTGLNNK